MIGRDLVVRVFRLGIVIGGEATQSALHFALNLVLMHRLSAFDYGVYALVMVMGGLALTYIRALTAMPGSIMIASSRTRYASASYDVVFGSVALALASLMGLAVAVVVWIWIGHAAVAAGLLIALWSVRSHLRTTTLARRLRMETTASDLAFAAGGLVAALAAIAADGDILADTLMALAVANALGIATLMLLVRRRPRVTLRRSARQRYARIRPQLTWSFLGVTAANVQGQGMALLVTALAGPAAYAPIAAVVVLFTPLRLMGAGLINFLQPEISRLLSEGRVPAARRELRLWSFFMGTAAFLYGAAVLIGLPMLDTEVLHGAPIYALGISAWILFTIATVSVMPHITLEVLSAFRALAYLTFAAAAFGMTVVLAILAVLPPAYALIGVAASEAVVLAGCMMLLRTRFARGPAHLSGDIADPRTSWLGRSSAR